DSEIRDAQQRGEGVDRAGAFGSAVFASDDEYADRCAGAIVLARGAKLVDVGGEYGAGDEFRVEFVALAVAMAVDACGWEWFGNSVSGGLTRAGDPGAVGADALDRE